jgi:hypothetical protein
MVEHAMTCNPMLSSLGRATGRHPGTHRKKRSIEAQTCDSRESKVPPAGKIKPPQGKMGNQAYKGGRERSAHERVRHCHGSLHEIGGCAAPLSPLTCPYPELLRVAQTTSVQSNLLVEIVL